MRFANYRRAHSGLKPYPPDPPPSAFRVVRPSIVARLEPPRASLTWLGHATFLIQIGGLNILTDPVWGARASPVSFAGPHRHVPPVLPLDALPPIDVVLLSHNHYDHLESSTVRWLARERTPSAWIVPLGLSGFVARRGATHIHELDWWESVQVGGVTFTGTPAQHFSRRTAFDAFRSLWCGFALRHLDTRIYFAGDTAYFPEFPLIGERLGPMNVALIPIGAYDPRSFMHYLHMCPEESIQAFQDLYARIASPALPVMVPMHWGTYKMTIEPLDEPPKRLLAAWRHAALPDESLRLLAHGESIDLVRA